MGKLIDCVLQHLAVENQHDMDAMLATLDGEDSCRDEVAGNNYVGRKAVAERYGALWQAFPDFNVFPRRLIEGPDCVVMLADYSGTHLGPYATLNFGEFPPTGKSFNIRLVNIIDFNGDKIARETIFTDVATQLVQLGVLRR
ncbi:MAG: ester cyclase [Hyphomicrobiales bacterium]|nr:ester cyclase [Hyphomicrobiales bacterium]